MGNCWKADKTKEEIPFHFCVLVSFASFIFSWQTACVFINKALFMFSILFSYSQININKDPRAYVLYIKATVRRGHFIFGPRHMWHPL